MRTKDQNIEKRFSIMNLKEMIRRCVGLIGISLALVGCTQIVRPVLAPTIDLNEVGYFQNKYYVDLINGQSDSGPQVFSKLKTGKTFLANYKEWTESFIDVYTYELQKRGVQISKASPNKIYVKVSDLEYTHDFIGFKGKIKIDLSNQDGNWTKEFSETYVSDRNMRDAFSGAFYNAVLKLLKDQEVLSSH